MIILEKHRSNSFESAPFITESTCNIWSETQTTWRFFLKTWSKEFTLSFDFKWIHLLPENSSDLEKKIYLISYALEVGRAISLKLQIKLKSQSYKAKQNKKKNV